MIPRLQFAIGKGNNTVSTLVFYLTEEKFNRGKIQCEENLLLAEAISSYTPLPHKISSSPLYHMTDYRAQQNITLNNQGSRKFNKSEINAVSFEHKFYSM